MIQAHTYLPDVLSGGATGAAWTMQQHIYMTAHPASPFEVAWSSVERRAPVVHADDVTPAAPRCLPVGHAAGATQRVGSGAHHRRAQGAPALPPLQRHQPRPGVGSRAMLTPTKGVQQQIMFFASHNSSPQLLLSKDPRKQRHRRRGHHASSSKRDETTLSTMPNG